VGAICNLACAYCFYLEKEHLYPNSSMRMSDEVLEAYIRQLLASQGASEISISWQGGEPTLMGLDFYKRSIELAKRYRKPDQRISYSLQTNGTKLDEAWCRFFKQHNFLIGISIDGPREIHNTYRLSRGGGGSFDQVLRGWELLQKYHVDTNILCTVHAANGHRPLDVYRFFRDELNARFIQFIPIVECLNAGAVNKSGGFALEYPGDNGGADLDHAIAVSQRSVKPELFGNFLIDIFEEWLHHDVGTVFIQTFEAALASWCHLPASICIFQEVCGSSLILEHNGDLYSCDHYVEPTYRLGNILENPMPELVNSPRQHKFGLDKLLGLPEYCRKCDVLFACHGECPRNRFVPAPGENAFINYLCPGYQSFFQHIDKPMRRMADLLRRGLPAAEIMRIIQASRIGQSRPPTGNAKQGSQATDQH
jgi:uncharacterized protein